MRAAAQFVSYEIPGILAVLVPVLLASSMSLQDIVRAQSGGLWYIFFFPIGPLAFLIFLIAGTAESNRTPFDLVEAESEIIAGFHTEYSGMRFALVLPGRVRQCIRHLRARRGVLSGRLGRADSAAVHLVYGQGECPDLRILLVPRNVAATPLRPIDAFRMEAALPDRIGERRIDGARRRVRLAAPDAEVIDDAGTRNSGGYGDNASALLLLEARNHSISGREDGDAAMDSWSAPSDLTNWRTASSAAPRVVHARLRVPWMSSKSNIRRGRIAKRCSIGSTSIWAAALSARYVLKHVRSGRLSWRPILSLGHTIAQQSLVFNMHQLRIPGTPQVDAAMEYIQGVKRGRFGSGSCCGSKAWPGGSCRAGAAA